jgi:hypothetical protein
VEAKEQERLPPRRGLTEIGEEQGGDSRRTVFSTPGPSNNLGERVGRSAIVFDRIRMTNYWQDGVVVAAHLGVWNEQALRNEDLR